MRYYILLLSLLLSYHYVQNTKGSTRLKKIDHTLDQQLLEAIIEKNSAEVLRLFDGNEIPDVNVTNWYGDTPLILASKTNLGDIVKFLINAGAHVNAKGGAWNAPILVHAAGAGNSAIVKILINAGANVDATDDQGTTALTQATMRASGDENINILDYAATVKMLLQAGANPYMGTKGKTAVDYAKKRAEIERIFIEFEKLQTPENKKSLRTAAQNIIAGKFPQSLGGQEDIGKRIQEFLRPTLPKQEEIKRVAESA